MSNITLTFHGFPPSLDEIAKSIGKSLKRRITRHTECEFCGRRKHVDELERDFLGRWICKGSKGFGCTEVNK